MRKQNPMREVSPSQWGGKGLSIRSANRHFERVRARKNFKGPTPQQPGMRYKDMQVLKQEKKRDILEKKPEIEKPFLNQSYRD